MKIAIDGRAAELYRGTGIGTYTYQLINNLNQIDFFNEYKIFLNDKCTLDFNLRNNFSLSNANSNSSDNFWEKVRIPNILKDSKTDIYHIPQNGVGYNKNINCNFTITLHDIIPLKMPETCSQRYLKIFNEEVPNIIKNCNGIITVSEFSKNDISKCLNVPKEKIFVTPLAPEDIYKPLNKDICKNYIKRKYKIESPFLLYVGGFSPRKNILGLIEAFASLKTKYKKDLSLVIIGSKGISYDLYKGKSEDLNISNEVLFPGFIELKDMPIFYNASKIFIYPSLYEGFGLPPLEAMACGTPVISSNLTSLPEVVGDAAIIINPKDIDSIKESLLNILQNKNLYKSLSDKGLLHSSTFNWKNTASLTIDSYKSMID